MTGMRLQLTVLRHGLPPTRVLWKVGQTNSSAATTSSTICQFLEQVNDIIPLESDDWGLEDYCIEVGGFECLHFFELEQVLKEDDEVCIRPLQTSDLRVRKISGRHQISEDGKHLIDGVAFGRPFLRKASRPPLRIPPRKRRRITYDEEDDVDTNDSSNDRQIVLSAGFENTDRVDSEDEDDDDKEFLTDEDDREDLAQEIEDLQEEANDGGDELVVTPGVETVSGRATRSSKGPHGLGLLQLLDENGRPFTGPYSNPLLDMYSQDEPSQTISDSKSKKRKRNYQNLGPKVPKGILQDHPITPEDASRRGSSTSGKSVRFGDAEQGTPITVLESEHSDNGEEEEFQRSEIDESDKENVVPRKKKDPVPEDDLSVSKDSDSDKTSEFESLDSDETSSSGTSSSDSDGEADPAPNHESEASSSSSAYLRRGSRPRIIRKSVNGKAPRHNTCSHSSIEGGIKSSRSRPSESNSNSTALDNEESDTEDTSDNGAVSKPVPRKSLYGKTPRDFHQSQHPVMSGAKPSRSWSSSSDSSSTELDSEHSEEEDTPDNKVGPMNTTGCASRPVSSDTVITSKSPPPTLQKSAPSGTGKNETRARNQRRREAKKLKALKGKGILSADATKADLRSLASGQPLPEQPGEEFDEPTRSGSNVLKNDDGHASELSLEGLKKRGFEGKAASGVPGIEDQAAGDISQNMEDYTEEVFAKDIVATDDTQAPIINDLSDGNAAPGSDSQHRRARLDLDSTKRMLFGSLGLRAPKTAEDVLKLKEKLRKDTRPIRMPKVDGEQAEDSDDQTWREKIDLRAVECCQDDIKLSTPPFPFVQRWDPQQQHGYGNRNGKGRNKTKKRKRDDSAYHAGADDEVFEGVYEDSYEDGFTDNWQSKAARSQGYVPSSEAPRFHDGLSYNDQNNQEGPYSYDQSFEDSQAANEQLLRETTNSVVNAFLEVEEEDLPRVPDDVCNYATLTKEMCTASTIIAFRKLEMSLKTKWEPVISDFKTALVEGFAEDGMLRMTLAKRDTPSKQIHYDEETGERVYGKLEMPGYDDEVSEEDGKIEILFEELINPILIRTADDADHVHETLNSISHGQQNAQTDGEVIEEHPVMSSGDNLRGLDDAMDEAPLVQEIDPMEEAREEISELIRDAGWRSSLPSEIRNDLNGLMNEDAPQGNEDTTLVDPPSTNFNGLSSSPLVNGHSHMSSPTHENAQSENSLIEEIADSNPPRYENESGRSLADMTVEYPSLPDLNDDSDIFEDGRQHRSISTDKEHQTSSEILISPPSFRQRDRQKSPLEDLSRPKSGPHSSDLNGADSENEFPELFSQKFESHLSQEIEIKTEASDSDAVRPFPKLKKSRANTKLGIMRNSLNKHPKRNAITENDAAEDGSSEFRPSQLSQIKQSSQIVDLTMSSDQVEAADDSYENDDDTYQPSNSLPTGSGWIPKRHQSSAASSQSSTNSVGPTRKAKVRSR